MQVYLGQATDIGIVRRNKNNQDSVGSDLDKGLFIAADGVGGAAEGEWASHTLVTRIKESVSSAKPNYQDRKNALVQGIKIANVEILQRSTQSGKKIGTTVTALLIGPGKYFIAQVGDSRAYLIRNNIIKKLTKDHSTVQKMVDAGFITADEARHHLQKNEIDRWVGISDLEIDTYEDEFRETDTMLLCSDGLWEPVSEKEILETVEKNENPQDACNVLVDLANHYGGPDNISVVIAKASPTSIRFKPVKRKKKIKVKRILKPLGIVIGLALVIKLVLIAIPIIKGWINPPKFAKELTIKVCEDSFSLPVVKVDFSKKVITKKTNIDSIVILNINQNNTGDTVFVGDTITFSKPDYKTVAYIIPYLSSDTTVIVNMEKTQTSIQPPPLGDTISEPKKIFENIIVYINGFTADGKATAVCGTDIYVNNKSCNKRVGAKKESIKIGTYKKGSYTIQCKVQEKVIATGEFTLTGRKDEITLRPYYDRAGNLHVK